MLKHIRYYWGTMFVAAAALIVLYYLGLLGSVSVFSVVFSVLLVPTILTSIRRRVFIGITVPIAIILWLFDDVLGIEKFTPWPALFTAVFLALGLTLLFPRKRAWYNTKTENKKNFAGVGAPEYDDGSEITINTRFNGTTRYIRSKQLKTVNIYASYAGAKIYFDNADIDGKEAVVNIDASACGIELFIPKNWHLDNEVSVMLGGIKERGAQESEVTNKTLILRGNCGMSGITITRI